MAAMGAQRTAMTEDGRWTTDFMAAASSSVVRRPSSDLRQAVVTEALSWIGTPYRTAQRVRGREGGADCLTLVAEIYERAGIIEHVEIPYYPFDWHLHRGVERYLDGVLRHAEEIGGPPQPGDLVLFRFGRCFAHGGIATSWPRLVHAWNGAGVVPVDADQALLGQRPRRFFSPF
jgi:cell wall-associated NlpC family hydrolase